MHFVVSQYAFLTPSGSWPEPPGIRGLKQQLAASEAKNGIDHPDLVEILLNLDNAYRDEGGYVPATPYVERALSITEKTHGPEQLEVAATLDRLGTLYLSQGDTARARTAYMRARPILLRELGQNNPGYGIFLLHLGELELLTSSGWTPLMVAAKYNQNPEVITTPEGRGEWKTQIRRRENCL